MQTLCARKQKSKHTSMPVWTENSTEVSRTWGWIWYQKIYPFYIHVSFKLIKLLFSTPLFVVRLNNWRGFFFIFFFLPCKFFRILIHILKIPVLLRKQNERKCVKNNEKLWVVCSCAKNAAGFETRKWWRFENEHFS